METINWNSLNSENWDEIERIREIYFEDYFRNGYNPVLAEMGIITNDHNLNIMDYFSDISNMSAPIFEKYKNGRLYDYIDENLRTHDYKLLQKKLKELFKDKILRFDDYEKEDNESSDKRLFKIYIKPGANIVNKEFKDLLRFFNYKKREQTADGGLLIEPIYPKKAGSYINNGIIYHFTLKKEKDIEHILKYGLRTKTGKEKYPARVYVYAPGDYINKIDKTEIRKFISELYQEDFDFIKEHLKIIKIDLHRLSGQYCCRMNFYQDTAMRNKHAFFTYMSVPPICLSLVPPKFVRSIFE